MVEYDPFDYAVHDDPYPIYKRLRDEVPVDSGCPALHTHHPIEVNHV